MKVKHTEQRIKYYSEVIKLHFKEGYLVKQISHMLPISLTTIRKWTSEYAQINGIKELQSRHKFQTDAFQKVQDLYETGATITAISRKVGLSRTTVYKWIAIFASEKEDNMHHNKKGQAFISSTDSEKRSVIEELEARLKETEEALRKAEMRAEAYDELINVAEAQFNISIRKKAGAKR